MLRIETRALLYGKHHNVSCTDYLGTTKDRVLLKPEYAQVGLGPFTLLRLINQNAPDEVKDQLKPVFAMFARGEPAQTYNYDTSKWKPGFVPPVLWRHPKPGPAEDPFLREYWLAAPFEDRVNSIFGFADMEAVAGWFPFYDQIHWMMENGFGIAEYRSKMVRHGLRQSVMLVNQPYELLGFKPLSEIVKVRAQDG